MLFASAEAALFQIKGSGARHTKMVKLLVGLIVCQSDHRQPKAHDSFNTKLLGVGLQEIDDVSEDQYIVVT